MEKVKFKFEINALIRSWFLLKLRTLRCNIENPDLNDKLKSDEGSKI